MATGLHWLWAMKPAPATHQALSKFKPKPRVKNHYAAGVRCPSCKRLKLAYLIELARQTQEQK